LAKLIELDNKQSFLKRDDLEGLVKRNQPGALIKLEDVQKLAKQIDVEKQKKRKVDVEVKFEDPSEKSHISQIPTQGNPDQLRA
jgi:hypothetical protein